MLVFIRPSECLLAWIETHDDLSKGSATKLHEPRAFILESWFETCSQEIPCVEHSTENKAAIMSVLFSLSRER